MSYSIVIALALVAVVAVNGQSISWGKCPDVAVQPNLALEQYNGTWYEEARFYAITETSMACVSQELTLMSNNTYEFAVRGTVSIFGHYMADGAIGVATPNATEPARMSIKFPVGPAAPFDILTTDYTTFSMAYTCVNLGPLKAEFAWIVRRDKSTPLPQATVDQIYRTCEINQIDVKKFSPSDPRFCRD